MDNISRPPLALSLVLGVLLASTAAGAGAVTAEPTAGPNTTAVEDIKAQRAKKGVRVTARLSGPLTAGEPARIRTRVTNTGSEPIEWYAGASGVTVNAEMVGESWRPGEPVAGSGPRVRQGLKEEIVSGLIPDLGLIQLYFQPKKVDGTALGSGSARIPLTIGPGESIAYVHEWDGRAHLAQGMVGDVGLPPSGPASMRIAAHYVGADGKAQSLTVKVETAVAGDGDDRVRLDPLEVVDAALADPGFAALMERLSPSLLK